MWEYSGFMSLEKSNFKLAKLLSVTFFVMIICMSVYELLKQIIYPDITIWQSHIVTISFSSVIGTAAAYFIYRSIEKLQLKTLREVRERKQAQELLANAYDDLEKRIEERTLELTKSNKRLREEIKVRHLTEAKLRRSEERFAKVFHNAPVAISIIDFEEGRISMVNDSFAHLMDCDDKDQVHGKTVHELDMWVDEQEWISMNYYLERNEDMPFAIETKVRTLLGERRTILLTAEKINVNGKASILAMLLDTTDKKKAGKLMKRAYLD